MINFFERANAHHGYVRTLRAYVRDYVDPHILYRDVRDIIRSILNESIILRLRLLICISVLFKKSTNDPNNPERKSFYFCSFAERILSNQQILPKIDNAFQKILQSIDSFVRNGSGWAIERIDYIDVHIGNYREIRGGCHHAQELPTNLKNKKCLINIKCHDEFCFLYCIAAKLFPKKSNKHRPLYYKKYFKYLNTRSVAFPMKISDVAIFEHNNNLIINVFAFEENEIYPLRISSKTSRHTEIDLFYYQSHYYLITSFNKLMNYKNGIHHFCKRCLNGFKRKETLISHQKICSQSKPQKLSIPKNLNLKFTAYNKMLYHPFAAFADFECLTPKISSAVPNDTTSFTVELERHEAVSYTLIVLDINDRIIFHEYYAGSNAIAKFLETLKYVAIKLISKMKNIMPMNTSVNKTQDENTCHICNKQFAPWEIKVRDHCHFSPDGHIRGMAHQWCNLNMRSTYFLPVIIHNARNYDNHLIIKEIPQNYAENINIIPINFEKFTTFSLDCIKFMDSFQFLDSSLDSLVNNLKNSNHDFSIFNQFFKNEKNSHLLLCKGIFPYSHFSCLSVLNESELPPKEAFFNRLTQCEISDDDYEHAVNVFNSFKCKSFAEYLEIYQNTDVLLLAEVFTSFRRMSMSYYNLDPVHFITTADLTWNAGLKLAQIELQLLGNVNEYIWFESQMRGGICYLGKRHAIANNPFLTDTYDSGKDSSYIVAYDANNLYGFVMVQSLPYGNFSWLSPEEIHNFNILDTTPDSAVGYILECDIHYPKELHVSHNDLPMAPEHLKITYEMLSPHAKNMCDHFNLKNTLPCKKLTPNFFDKHNYISHYRNLKFYVENGLIITKIHKILAFSQKPWLADYINFNNNKRQEAKNEFEKNFFKKMNNSYYGKTSQNVRKRINVRGALNVKDSNRYLSSPSLEYFEAINNYLTLFKCKKINLILDKPIYAGFTVLELSKLHMYDLYYSNFKKIYDDKCSLLYMDTDSFYLEIRCDNNVNVYSDIKKRFNKIMDHSNFPTNHMLFDDTNKGKLGALKSECTLPIKEFVGLRCKLYSFSYGGEIKKRAKGVKRSAMKDITFQMYKDALAHDTIFRKLQYSIISKKHDIFTTMQNKIALSSFYDKRFLIDSINSNAYGHYHNDRLNQTED